MALRNNTIAMFNALMIRNKRDLIASIETYIERLQSIDNESIKHPSRHQLNIDIFQEFLANIKHMELPALTEPLTCYEYYLQHTGISLEISHYDFIKFDEDNNIKEGTASSREIYLLPCELMTVSEYAELSGVTVVTVRQWIRRGKLRSAQKNGRDWLIPALSTPPQRGYVSATYYWDHLSDAISDSYTFLPASGYLYMHQSRDNKQLFTALITNKTDNSYRELQFDSKDRERLELALISESTVSAESDTEFEIAPLSQKSGTLPYLATRGATDLEIRIMAKPIYYKDSAIFNGKATAGDSYYDGDADNYVIPVLWELYDLTSATAQKESVCPEQPASGDKIGTVSGHLILTSQIIKDACDPVAICDDISADLGNIMSVMSGPAGPLNEYISDENMLYVHEIKMESDYETPELKGRVIRELPWLCMRFLYVRPEIIVYCISELLAEDKQKELSMPYMQNGFARVGESNVIYAYTE